MNNLFATTNARVDRVRRQEVWRDEQQNRRLPVDSKEKARGLQFTALLIIIARFLEVVGVRNIGVETKYCFGQHTRTHK